MKKRAGVVVTIVEIFPMVIASIIYDLHYGDMRID